MSIERSGTDSRRSILRDVYEDNLGIERKKGPSRRAAQGAPAGDVPPRKERHGWAGVLVVVLLTTLVTAGLGYLVLSPPAAPASSLAASSTAEEGFLTGRQVAGPAFEVPGAMVRPAGTPQPDSGAAPVGALADLPLASLFNLQVRTIVIDPGHGGDKVGAVGPTGLQEKTVALDVAHRLRERLEARGTYRVLMTRDDDHDISLHERVDFANAHAADLFVSIHINWLPVEDVTSIETYYFGKSTDARTRQIAERENQQADLTIAEFNEMLQDMGQTMRLQESKRLATSIQKNLYRNIHRINPDVDNWGVKTAPFVVLLGVEAPSVLAEVAVISNQDEELKLRSQSYREQLAAYLEEGIVQYLDERSGRSDDLRPVANASSNN